MAIQNTIQTVEKEMKRQQKRERKKEEENEKNLLIEQVLISILFLRYLRQRHSVGIVVVFVLVIITFIQESGNAFMYC